MFTQGRNFQVDVPDVGVNANHVANASQLANAVQYTTGLEREAVRKISIGFWLRFFGTVTINYRMRYKYG